MKRCWLAILVLLLAWRGVERNVAAADPLQGETLVFAAASTTDVLAELVARFEREHPDADVRTSLGASSQLARQIDAGAKADLFLSANSDWADFVAERQPAARRRDLLSNALVVVVPSDSKRPIESLGALADASVRRVALADTASVPAGMYARQALEKLDLWDRVRGKVTGASDVRQALRFVETGAAQAGIVYATDAAASRRVRVAMVVDPALYDPVVYPLVLLGRGADNPVAVAFYDFLASPAAAEIFARHGFGVIEPPHARAGE